MAERPRPRWQLYAVLVAIVAVVLFPGFAFSHPGTNDAIWLADAEWPLILLEVTGALVAYFVFGGQHGAWIRAGVGVFLIGAATALALGLVVFGNTSNDRFGALLILLPVFGFLGLVGIVVAVATGAGHKAELLRGAGYGLIFAILVAVYTLARGANTWLLAPYGIDVMLLIGVLAAGLVVLGTSQNLKRRSQV